MSVLILVRVRDGNGVFPRFSPLAWKTANARLLLPGTPWQDVTNRLNGCKAPCGERHNHRATEGKA